MSGVDNNIFVTIAPSVYIAKHNLLFPVRIDYLIFYWPLTIISIPSCIVEGQYFGFHAIAPCAELGAGYFCFF